MFSKQSVESFLMTTHSQAIDFLVIIQTATIAYMAASYTHNMAIVETFLGWFKLK
jgi:hypothetical protein